MTTFGNEQILAEKLAVKDHVAFSYVYDHYSAALFAEILRIVRQREVAEDLLQDVFLSIYQNGHSFIPARGRLYTWMLTITRNRCIDYLRMNTVRRTGAHEDIEKSADIPAVQTRMLEFTLLYKNIGTLCPQHRQLLQLIYVHGMTQKEAATHCHLPVGTVKTRVRKVIQMFKGRYTQVN